MWGAIYTLAVLALLILVGVVMMLWRQLGIAEAAIQSAGRQHGMAQRELAEIDSLIADWDALKHTPDRVMKLELLVAAAKRSEEFESTVKRLGELVAIAPVAEAEDTTLTEDLEKVEDAIANVKASTPVRMADKKVKTRALIDLEEERRSILNKAAGGIHDRTA